MLPFSLSSRFIRGVLLVLLTAALIPGLFLLISSLRAGGGQFANGWFASWPLVNLYFDSTTPSVSITSPGDQAIVSGTIAVEVATSDDSGLGRVELYKDGVLFAQDALAPFEFLWSTALETDGVYTLEVLVADAAGNSAVSQPVRVTVRNPPSSPKPNIVVVLTDDQRWDTMQYMPVTNSLLYAESVRFTRAIAAVPLCCPSRTTIFTGLYSHNHGIIDNMPPYGGAPVFKEKVSSTVAVWLKGAGYQTGLFGKFLNAYDQVAPYIPPGWDEFNAFLNSNGNYYNYSLVENGVTVAYGHRPEEYATDVITRKAVEFIGSAAADEPVFVYLAPFAPHSTNAAVDSLPTPGPGDDGRFAFLTPWRPASYDEAELSDKPLWVRNLPRMSAEHMAQGDQFRIKQIESLQAVDRAVGELVRALIRSGRYENTVFIFLSDNGLSWGEHRWNMKKWCAYEECIRIPMWVRLPGVGGREDVSLVNDVDLAATLAELAGARPPSRLDGLSLVDLIANPQSPWRSETFSEYISPAAGGEKMIFRMVRSARYKYAEYGNSDREFYDLAVDPLEAHNRIDDPGYADIIDGLEREMQVMRGE